MAFNREKFKTLAHYICWRFKNDPSRLGAVKLNKSLWVADFTAYYTSGVPITGARYVKRKYGPVPSAIVPVMAELQSEGAVHIKRDTFYHGFFKTEYEVLAEPDMSVFGETELAIANDAIEFVCEQHTATSISKASHDHIWKMAEIGEELPYYTVFATPGEITEDEREWARTELEAMGR